MGQIGPQKEDQTWTPIDVQETSTLGQTEFAWNPLLPNISNFLHLNRAEITNSA